MGSLRARWAGAALAAALVVSAGGALAGPREHLEVGLKAYRDGFHELAAKELRAYLEAKPDDPDRRDLLDLLFRAEVARKNPEGARWALERLVEADDPEARYWLGWLAWRVGRPEEAREHLGRYLDEGGGAHAADAWLLAAAAAEALGHWRDAAEMYRAFLAGAKGDSRRASAWLGLVGALSKEGAPGAVAAACRESLADPGVLEDREARLAIARAGAAASQTPEDAAFFWERVAEWTPDREERARALLGLGRARAEAGNRDGAGRALEGFLQLVPKGEEAVSARLLLADLAREAKDLRGALRHLEGALAAGAEGARALEIHRAAFALAKRLGDGESLRRHGRAILDRGAKAVPRDELDRVRWTLADDARARGRWQEAVALWDGIAEGSALGRSARVEAARALLENGKPGEALRRIEPLLGAQSTLDEWLLALAAAEAAGDAARAARFAEAAAGKAPPGEAPALLERAAVHAEASGDGERARVLRVRLAQAYPGSPQGRRAALMLQAEAFQAQDWAEVLRWSAAAREADASGAAAFREAEALARIGRAPEARKRWEELAGQPGPFRGRALLRLGLEADRSGDPADALARYRAALEAGLPPEAETWVRGRIEELEGGRGG
ncbi:MULTISPECIES: tetratricopeptide repeat protein [Deferrisoma]